MEYLYVIAAFGALVTILIGAVLAFVNTTRINRLERTARDLRLEIRGLESRLRQADRPTETRETPDAPDETAPPATSPEATGVDIASPVAESPREVPPGPSERVDALAPEIEREPFDLESLVAGRWLNRVGIVAVLFATAFFLKLAFDNQWIGPAGRVTIGLVAGLLLLAGSHWLLGRGYRYFSEGITALGGGVLFLALYAAWDVYQLVGQWAALAGMIATTALLTWIARTRASERLGVLALAAGFLAPALLLGDEDPHLALFAYLAVLITAFLALAWKQTWRAIAPLALLGLLIHGLPWFAEHYTPTRLTTTLGFATWFFACFLAYTVLCARRGRKLDLREIFLPLANGAWFGLTLFVTLFDEHRWGLTLAVLAAGGVHLVALSLIGERDDRQSQAVRMVLGGLALTSLTAAIPIRLEGAWIGMAWAIEAAALVWAGFETRIRPLRGAGMALFVPVLMLLTDQNESTTRLFLNERFAAFLAAGGGLAASTLFARRHEGTLGPDERRLYPVLGIAAVAVGVWSLSVELWWALERWNLTENLRLTRQLGLSLLWILLATLLLAIGMRRDSKVLRFEGLALLGLTIVKVFLADLSFLDNAYRIASFLVLGIVLLAVSFKYQRSLSEARDKDPTNDV